MAQIIPGYTTEQKVVIVEIDYDGVSINASIQAEAADSWLVSSLTFSGSDVIILFSRTIATTPA